MLWWLLHLASGLGGGLPGPLAHGWLMLYGLFSFFVFGFLCTAMPNWLDGPAIPRLSYLAGGLGMTLGSLLFYLGLFLPAALPIALALHLAAYGVGVWGLGRLAWRTPHPETLQPRLAWAALALGGVGNAFCLMGTLLADARWLAAGIELAIWGYLTPLFLVVCHRMLPWFTSRVLPNYLLLRPYGPLWAMLAACLGHAALVLAGWGGWTWLTDLPLALLAAWFSGRWGVRRGLATPRLLAMLHIAFLWAGMAFALYALDGLLRLLGLTGLGRAPLHALGIGFFGAMLLAMASRVSLGHSGRKLEADGYTWGLFWLVQLAALARLAPDIAPALADERAIWLSAGLWLAAFTAWSARYAPYYWRPRLDGKPG